MVIGVRQIGKTYTIQKFIKENYEEYLYFNLEKDEHLRGMFERTIDAEKIFEEIRKYGKYILKNRYLSIKYKISVIIIAISPSLFMVFNKLLDR